MYLLQHRCICMPYADLARRITAAVTGNSMHTEEGADESEEEEGMAISDASDEEDATAEDDWDRALPQFITRPRSKQRRLLGDAATEDASTGALLNWGYSTPWRLEEMLTNNEIWKQQILPLQVLH